MHATGFDRLLPSQIVGFLSAFAGLSAFSVVAPGPASALHLALMPGVGWVNRWLPVFLVPVQVTIPTIHFAGGPAEAAAYAAVLVGGWLVSIVCVSRAMLLMSPFLPAASTAASAAASAVIKRPLWVPALWLLAAGIALPAGIIGGDVLGSDEHTRVARTVGLASLGVGSFAAALKCGLPGHIGFLAVGIVTIAATAAIASCRGISYDEVVRQDYLAGSVTNPQAGSGDLLLWFLSPALVATGVQMFQYRSRVLTGGAALVVTCAFFSLANILSTVAVGPALGMSPEVTLGSTVRCITVPMGIPIYKRLCDEAGVEGNFGVMALATGLSGFIGFGFSAAVLSSALCRTTAASHAVARGTGAGASGHVLASSGLVATEPEAFVWGMLAMAVTGITSAAWICACPPVRDLVISLAYRKEGIAPSSPAISSPGAQEQRGQS